MFGIVGSSWRKHLGYSNYLDLFQDYFSEEREPTLEGFATFISGRKLNDRQIDIHEISCQVFGLLYFQTFVSQSIRNRSAVSIKKRDKISLSYTQKFNDVLLTIQYHLNDLKVGAFAPKGLPAGIRYSWERTSAMSTLDPMDRIRNDFGFVLSLYPFPDRLLRLMNGENIPLVAKIISEQKELFSFIASHFTKLVQFPHALQLKMVRQISFLKHGAMVSFREEERGVSNGKMRVFRSLVVSSWLDEIALWVRRSGNAASMESLKQTFKIAHLFRQLPEIARSSQQSSIQPASSSSIVHGRERSADPEITLSFQEFLICRSLDRIISPDVNGEFRDDFYNLFRFSESTRLDFLFFWQALHSLLLSIDREIRPTLKEVIDKVIPPEGIDPYQRATLIRNRIFNEAISKISNSSQAGPSVSSTSRQINQEGLAEQTCFLSTLLLNVFILEHFIIKTKLDSEEKTKLWDGLYERSKKITHRLKQISDVPLVSLPTDDSHHTHPSHMLLDRDHSSSDDQDYLRFVIDKNKKFDQSLHQLLLRHYVPHLCYRLLCENRELELTLDVFLTVFDLSCLFLEESNQTTIDACFSNLKFPLFFRRVSTCIEWGSSIQKSLELGRNFIRERKIGEDHPAFCILDSLLCLYLVEERVPLHVALRNLLFEKLIHSSPDCRYHCIDEISQLIIQEPLFAFTANELDIQEQAFEIIEKETNIPFPLISILASLLYKPFNVERIEHLRGDCWKLTQQSVFSSWLTSGADHFKSLWDLLSFFPHDPTHPLFKACIGSLKEKFSNSITQGSVPLKLENIINRHLELIDPFQPTHPRYHEIDSHLFLWVCEEMMPMSDGAKVLLFERIFTATMSCRMNCLKEISQFTNRENPLQMRKSMLETLWKEALGQATFQSYQQPENWIDFQIEVIRRIEMISGNAISLVSLLIIYLYCPYLPCRGEGDSLLLLQNLETLISLRGIINLAETNTLFIDPSIVNQIDSLTLCLLDYSNTVVSLGNYTNGSNQRDYLDRHFSLLNSCVKDVLIPSSPCESVIVDLLKSLINPKENHQLEHLQGKVDFIGKEHFIQHLRSVLGAGYEEIGTRTYIGELPTILYMVKCNGLESKEPLTFEITFWRSLYQLDCRTIVLPFINLEELKQILFSPPPKKDDDGEDEEISSVKDVRTASAFKLTLIKEKERDNSVSQFFSLLDKMLEEIGYETDNNLKNRILSLQSTQEEQEFCLEHYPYVLEKWDNLLRGAEGCDRITEALFSFVRELRVQSRRAIAELYRTLSHPEKEDELQVTLEAIVDSCRKTLESRYFSVGFSDDTDLKLSFNSMVSHDLIAKSSSSSSEADTNRDPQVSEESSGSLNSFTAILSQNGIETSLSMKLGDLLDHPRASYLLRWLVDKVHHVKNG